MCKSNKIYSSLKSINYMALIFYIKNNMTNIKKLIYTIIYLRSIYK